MTLTNDDADLYETAYAAALQYMNEMPTRPVVPTAEAIDCLEKLKEPMPDHSTNPKAVIEKLHEIGAPTTVATTGGRYFGFVVGGALPVSIAANWLAATWDQNAGTWVLSPIAAELEDIAGQWLLELFDLPRDTAFGFVTGATMATFSSIAVARSALLRRRGYDFKADGLMKAPNIRIITSEEVHPTNLAALGYAGFGLNQVEYVPTDDQGRIRVDSLPELDDLSIVILQAGNINSGSFDDFGQYAELPGGQGRGFMWTVPLAYGRGSAKVKNILPMGLSWQTRGVSMAINGLISHMILRFISVETPRPSMMLLAYQQHTLCAMRIGRGITSRRN
ncbi:MAG: hypothetical protein DHS20C05_00960 [Hyphococcus sp.]|nr:MAG: hypothetical protein DHS20C05_00960 [Marinicaulis sp.]